MGYAGRDPLGGTSDGSFVNKLSLNFFLLVMMIFTMKCERNQKDVGDLIYTNKRKEKKRNKH